MIIRVARAVSNTNPTVTALVRKQESGEVGAVAHHCALIHIGLGEEWIARGQSLELLSARNVWKTAATRRKQVKVLVTRK